MNSEFTFSLLYNLIVDEWSWGATWRRLAGLLAALFLLFTFLGGLALCFVRPEAIYAWLGKMVVCLGSVLSLALLALAIGFLVLNGLRNVHDEAPRIAAWLLMSEYRPYFKGRGLNSVQISALKQMAESEQGAADWRGSFITILVLGILISGTLNLLKLLDTKFGNDFAARYIGIVLGAFGIAPWRDSPALTTSVTSQEWAIITVSSFCLLSLIWIFANYVYRFLAREHANQVILIACIEALELLRTVGLDKHYELTFWERGALITYLGYSLIPIGMTSGEPQRIDIVTDPNGVRWRIERRESLSLRRIWLQFIMLCCIPVCGALLFLDLQDYVGIFKLVAAGLLALSLFTLYAHLRYAKEYSLP